MDSNKVRQQILTRSNVQMSMKLNDTHWVSLRNSLQKKWSHLNPYFKIYRGNTKDTSFWAILLVLSISPYCRSYFSLNILKCRFKWLHFFCKLFLNDTQCASFNFIDIRTLDLVGICCQTLFEPKCYFSKILFEPKCYFLPNHIFYI